MDTGVDLNEHPDGWGHVTNASPHRKHSSGVVVLLESCAALSLDQNNNCVENLVKLGEVEPPAPKCEALVPHPAYIGGIWETVYTNMNVGISASPSVRVRIVCNCIAETSGSLDLAERVDSANERVRLPPVGE